MKRRHVSLILSVWMLLTFLGPVAPSLRAEGPQIGLVVQEGDDTITTYCVELDVPEITGYEVLSRAGLDVAVTVQGSMGAGVCRIGDTGCPGNDCFCDFPPNYWSYWHLREGQWVYSQAGASAYKVRAGNVEGWLWGRGNPPQVISLSDICAPATEAPKPTATATSTHSPPPPTGTATIPVASSTPEAAAPSETARPAETATPPATRQPKMPTASATATAAEPTVSPTAARPPATENADPQGTSPTSYILFGVLLVALGGIAMVVRARRR